MTQPKNADRQSDHTTEKNSPDYRGKNSRPAEQPKDCHPVKPPAAPSSAAENHDDANQKCEVSAAQTESKDEREKATG